MDKIRIIYNENFFREEPMIIIVIVAVTVLTILITSYLVIRELKEKRE